MELDNKELMDDAVKEAMRELISHDGPTMTLTSNILRHWERDKIRRFALHLIGEQYAANGRDGGLDIPSSSASDCSVVWRCPWCGCDETWFDRTVSYGPDGVEYGYGTENGMKTRCVKCGRTTDDLPNARPDGQEGGEE